MKRWGLRASSLSAVAKADAGQKHSRNHLTPNVLYMMLPPGWYFFPKSKVLGNCFIGSTFITRFKQGSFQEIQNTLL